MNKKLLWTQTGIAAATGGSVMRPFEVRGIAIDSRTVEHGDLFIALKARRDGHYFIRNAALNGAVAAIVTWKPKNIPAGFPVIFVRNTDDGLEKLAKASRARVRAKIIAVTGTAGKTTTKEILRDVLSKQGITHASEASLNNRWGVPLSLARMPADTQYGIFEIGMNHAGEITPLTKLVRPDIAIITTVGAGHAEFFDSEEAIADAKAEILQGVKAGGTALLNRDIIHFERLKTVAEHLNLKIISFGTHEDSHIRVISVTDEGDKSRLEISVHGNILNFVTGLKGKHNALNIASVMGALSEMGADIAEAAICLNDITATAGRGATKILATPISDGTFTLVDESYNANPLSMHAALDVAKDIRPEGKGLKIIVLGDMRELGEKSEALHADLKDSVLAGGYDKIYLIGEFMGALYDALGEDAPAICALYLGDVIEEIIADTIAGSYVMVKGSNSIGLGHLIQRYHTLAEKQTSNSQTDDTIIEGSSATDIISQTESMTSPILIHTTIPEKTSD